MTSRAACITALFALSSLTACAELFGTRGPSGIPRAAERRPGGDRTIAPRREGSDITLPSPWYGAILPCKAVVDSAASRTGADGRCERVDPAPKAAASPTDTAARKAP